ncbi:MFS family permease [Sphingomonas naasensis]|uniref:Uncharacterized protein n=1 Tax=Sphingomonas naasensis TaxID=1344951 RepID=A0A4S1WEB1_9SPHN|nr:hypothetical protein [Sphingomonas naasensis]NIJ21710.1 MFS family permease [Sphingomonas naasensis]TGX41364.1 hypothetical protein E5A74_12035 [Sphingomonas naasensis]
MDLIERYLASVRQNLPADKADDIIAELHDELATRQEMREDRLGRPLRRDELAALLKEFGHPLVIASRYRSQQYLIGPDIFPFYLFALRVVLTIGALSFVSIGMVATLLGNRSIVHMVTGITSDLWGFFFTAIAVVTLAFALFERFGGPVEQLVRWTPEQLPAPLARRKGQWEAAFEVGCGIAFLLWWTGAVPFPAIAATTALRIEPAPVWGHYYLPILVLASAQLVANLVKWLLPRLWRFQSLLTVAISVATIAMAAGLYKAGAWVTVIAADKGEDLARLTQSLNLSIRITLIVMMVVLAFQALGELWKLARGDRAATAYADAR